MGEHSDEFEVDDSREISEFDVEVLAKMGTKRAAGSASFIDSVVDLFELIYGEVLQSIKPWQEPAPKLSERVTDLIPGQISSSATSTEQNLRTAGVCRILADG